MKNTLDLNAQILQALGIFKAPQKQQYQFHKYDLYSRKNSDLFLGEISLPSHTKDAMVEILGRTFIVKSIENITHMNSQTSSAEPLNILEELKISYLYHMTHIDNLESILAHGILSHDNKFKQVDISNQEVNSRRKNIEPLYHRSIHSYVPFYFNPKNAMLYVQKEKQHDIVILAVNRSLLFACNNKTNKNVIFTDGNASSHETKFYNELPALYNLDWNCIHDEHWTNHNDGRRIKMSEVLFYDKVPVHNILKIYCNNIHSKIRVDLMVKKHLNLDVLIDSSLFFN